ncbi:MAG: DUF2029 domain-containing protein [Acidobacteria bacterium]|nr:DUF2029 domain-containing protein [Acidobacteriota bacterium]
MNPYALLAGVLALGLAAAPLVYHHFDVRGFFLVWARATEGAKPWAVYAADLYPPCDYPPLVPYLLTLAEAGRRLAHAPRVGAISLVLLKLPGLLAYAALVPLCAIGLRRTFGESHARLSATLCALCAPLFVNAALWGQFDAVTSALLVAALVVLLNGRPVVAGGLVGLALSAKLMVVVSIPTLAVWAWRRHGPGRMLAGAAAGALALALVAGPHILAGAGSAMLGTYTGAVGFYDRRTMEACNIWYLLDIFDIYVRGVPKHVAPLDSRPALGPLTFRELGLLLFGGYATFVAVALARRPTPYVLALGTAMNHFAFFMLPTEIQGRYVTVIVPLLAVAAPLSARAAGLFLGLCVTATLGPGLELTRQVLAHGQIPGLPPLSAFPDYRLYFRSAAALVAAVNVALFAWGTVAFWKEAVAAPPRNRPE